MEEKKSFLHKELNLAFVYIFIFIVGLGIVFAMVTYINDQVKNFSSAALEQSLDN